MPKPTRKPKKTGRELTGKRARFAEEYSVDLNATQAAIRAGYSERTANEQGARLLANVSIAAAIGEAQQARSDRTEITQDMVVRELARIAFADQRAVMTWGPDGVRLRDSSELTDAEAALVAEVAETRTKDGGSLRLKTNSKVSALELLGKHLGMFTDRLKVGALNEDLEKEIRELKAILERELGVSDRTRDTASA